jgi:serine/threonine protein kinase
VSEHGANAIPDPMIGQRIRGYVIRQKLAEGGMGAVYVATHERLENTRKVIKILLPSYARHSMLRDRFEREALAVSRLRHKHIVTIDDFGQLDDGQLFFMMPFLEGRALDTYLADHGKFTEHRALHIIVQVCSALQHMHDVGIVHRDIKPSNIFIVQDDDNPYRVVLIDLGIAKSLSDRELVTHAGTRMGTPAYMAVEQHEDAANVTPAADLYAVAIVTWEMVAGSMPWGSHTMSAELLYAMKRQQRPSRPPGMSAEWYATLLGALSVHLEDRPPSMRALAVALASTVPAIPPHVPSGAEILAQLAKPFVQHAPPDDDTVRNGSQQDRVAPMLWPPRETQTPESRALSPLDVHAARSRYDAGPATPIARPAARQEAPPTTLTESVGVAVARTAPMPRTLAIAVATVCTLVAAVVAYAVAQRGPRDATPARTAEPSVTVQDAASTTATASIDAGLASDAADGTVGATTIDVALPAVPVPRSDPRRPIVQTTPSAAKAADVTKPGSKPAGSRESDGRRGSSSKFDPDAVGGGDE